MKRRTFLNKREACLVKMRETVETFIDLQGYIADNWRYFWCRHGNEKAPELLSIQFVDMTWTVRARNTHSAPFNGEENFMGDLDKPRSYPGWTGTIRYKYADILDLRRRQAGRHFESDLWRQTGINTGTGGGGGRGYQYGVILYADDWLGMSKIESWKALIKTSNANAIT